MNTEHHADDYEDRLEAAGGVDPLMRSLATAVQRSRRIQYLTVAGMIVLLGISAVLTLTVIEAGKAQKRSVENTERGLLNQKRILATGKQANDIVRCLSTAKDPGRCLGATVTAGTPGSAGLRAIKGAPGLPGPRGKRGPRGPAPKRITCGPAAPDGTTECIVER